MYSIMIVRKIRGSLPRLLGFKQLGFQVSSVAKNGREALERYAQEPVDKEEPGSLLCELKKSLDRRFKIRWRSDAAEYAKRVRKLYRKGNGDRSAFQDFLLMHCVPASSDGRIGSSYRMQHAPWYRPGG